MADLVVDRGQRRVAVEEVLHQGVGQNWIAAGSIRRDEI